MDEPADEQHTQQRQQHEHGDYRDKQRPLPPPPCAGALRSRA